HRVDREDAGRAGGRHRREHRWPTHRLRRDRSRTLRAASGVGRQAHRRDGTRRERRDPRCDGYGLPRAAGHRGAAPMIARLLRLALHQRFVSVVLALALVGLGVWAFTQLSIEAYPDISDTQVVVITVYPGHAAEDMEQHLSIPIERALNSVPQVI